MDGVAMAGSREQVSGQCSVLSTQYSAGPTTVSLSSRDLHELLDRLCSAAVRNYDKSKATCKNGLFGEGNCRTEYTQKGPTITENRRPICKIAAFGAGSGIFRTEVACW